MGLEALPLAPFLLLLKSVLQLGRGRSSDWAPSGADLQEVLAREALGVALCGRPSDAQVSGDRQQQMRGEGFRWRVPPGWPLGSSDQSANGGKANRSSPHQERVLVQEIAYLKYSWREYLKITHDGDELPFGFLDPSGGGVTNLL